MFSVCMFSAELTQVWPSSDSDKKLSNMYKYKNITETKYKNDKIQKYNYEMFCGSSELTQVWPPGDSSDQAASQPRRQKYQIICLTQNSNSSISWDFRFSQTFQIFCLFFLRY